MRIDMSSSKKRFLVWAVAIAGLVGLGYYAYTSFRQPLAASLPAAPASAAQGPGGAAPARPIRIESARVLASRTGARRERGRFAALERVGRPASRDCRSNRHDQFSRRRCRQQRAAPADASMGRRRRPNSIRRGPVWGSRRPISSVPGAFAKKFISQQALDNAQAALKVQEAALALAQARFEKTRIRAPFSGIVGIRKVSVGDYVKEGQDLVNIEDIGR
jgi:membrane fusion protein (multidrug efflux system)